VTGSNKGIGKAIVEKLAKALGSTGEWDVYLTARNEEFGKQALSDLEKKGLRVKFHQLDINDPNSRKSFLQFLKTNYPDGINIAVNNAGIAYKHDSAAPFGEQARVTLQTNFFDTLTFTEEFIPLLAKDARMASVMALPKLSEELYKKFKSPMTLDEVRSLAHDFVRHAEKGDHVENGWSDSAYGISKVCLTKTSYILGEQLAKDPRNIVLNSCCPGYVDTDLTSHKGHRTTEDGADTPFYLATLPIGVKEPINEFVSQRQIRKWSRSTSPVL
ncbi:Carbonyl reductase, partial [Fasciolopsis buskii]